MLELQGPLQPALVQGSFVEVEETLDDEDVVLQEPMNGSSAAMAGGDRHQCLQPSRPGWGKPSALLSVTKETPPCLAASRAQLELSSGCAKAPYGVVRVRSRTGGLLPAPKTRNGKDLG